MNAVKLNIFISTWYKNANQYTFSKVTVMVNDKKFWKLHVDEHTKRQGDIKMGKRTYNVHRRCLCFTFD